MCSVSWVSIPDGYHLIFNRDERISRLPARPPEVKSAASVNWLSPTDGDFGGTWIGTNVFGVTLGLVNFYPEIIRPVPAQKQSRGFIIPGFIQFPSAETIRNQFSRFDFSVFEPFELLVFDQSESSFIVRWDGKDATFRTATPEECPLASSSFVTREVVAYRRKTFGDMMKTSVDPVTTQRAFHTELRHPDRAYNPRMLRIDAKTVSISEVQVTGSAITFDYFDLEGVDETELFRRSARLEMTSRFNT